MKTTGFFLCIFCFSFFNMTAQGPGSQDYYLLIGTYSVADKPNGIHVYQFNSKDGAFKMARPVTVLANASYLAISRDKKNVYAVNEGEGGGSVNSFTFDPSSGALTFLNSVPAHGPCYVSVDNKKKVVFVGNYGGGSLQAIQIKTDGSFMQDNIQTIQYEGRSVVKDRQEKSHVHSVVLSLDDHYLMVPDLGTDKVYQYRVDNRQSQPLTPVGPSFLTVKPGGGPRHLTFHPDGKYAYLVLELEASVMALDYRDGKLSAKQTISMVAPDFKGKVSAADIHISPDGKFLYASNRGDANEIVIYSIDKEGKLTFLNRQSVLGQTPRNFAIDPTGNFLLVANQNTNEVIIFKRDPDTGLLTATGKKIEVDKPVCLKFVAIGK